MTTKNSFRGVGGFAAADFSRRASVGFVLLAVLSLFWIQSACSQQVIVGRGGGVQQPRVPGEEPGGEEICGTMEHHERLLEIDPEYRKERVEIERFTEAFRENRNRTGFLVRPEIVVIPVVVHVVYKNSSENISMAQIESQIDALNEDFRKLNSDANLVPPIFLGVAADARVQFCLARRDPNCQPTNGVTRTQTTVNCFTDSNTVKFTASGGIDAWPRNDYLNIWVADLCGGLMGYAQFPGGSAATDGVVLQPTNFGRTGTAAVPFELGRITTHEIGHWLNLYHLFQGGCSGTSASNCVTAGDRCCDTPQSASPQMGCPSSLNADTCIETPVNQPDMWMNYMQYTNNACMYMFTADQATRMDATLFGFRLPLLESQGCVPPLTVSGADLWSQDRPDDIGEEPNTASSPMWASQDIWVRKQNDGFTNQHHQNPVYRSSGNDNYVYVRVRNRGCVASSSADTKLYWAKASSALGWESPFDGSVTSPALMGGLIGIQPTGSVASNGSVILEFPWDPPNPSDYSVFGADKSHFCLLARIETSSSAPYGMTFPEGGSLFSNVKNNNNIVWKNINVADDDGNFNSSKSAWVTVGDYDGKSSPMRLVFEDPEIRNHERSAMDWGEVRLSASREILDLWRRGGRVGEGVEDLGNGEIRILRPGAFIGNIRLRPLQISNVEFRFIRNADTSQTTDIFWFDVTQFAEPGRLVGGQRFFFATDGTADPNGGPGFVRGDANSDGVIDLTDGVAPLLFIFAGGQVPACLDAADTNDSGAIEVTDAIVIFSWLFSGGNGPMEPSPRSSAYSSADCGVDPTYDSLDCERYSSICE